MCANHGEAERNHGTILRVRQSAKYTEEKDMNKKVNYILRIVLGLYLAFVGGKLTREMLMERPSDMAFKLFMGAVFIAVGLGYVIWIIKSMAAEKKKEQEEERKAEAAEAAERKIKQRRERAREQSRTAPMPSQSEIVQGMAVLGEKDISETEGCADSEQEVKQESELQETETQDIKAQEAGLKRVCAGEDNAAFEEVQNTEDEEEETDFEEV